MLCYVPPPHVFVRLLQFFVYLLVFRCVCGLRQNLAEMCFHEGDAVYAQNGLALITERTIAHFADWRVVTEYFRAMRMFQLTDKPQVIARIGMMNAALKGATALFVVAYCCARPTLRL